MNRRGEVRRLLWYSPIPNDGKIPEHASNMTIYFQDRHWCVVRGSNTRHIQCKRSDPPILHTDHHIIITCISSYQISCAVSGLSLAHCNVDCKITQSRKSQFNASAQSVGLDQNAARLQPRHAQIEGRMFEARLQEQLERVTQNKIIFLLPA